MSICPSCGGDNPDSAHFCRGCGKSMAATAASPTLPGGTELPTANSGRSGSANAVLVIVLVLALVGLAGAAGYYFLARSAGKTTEIPVSTTPPPLPAEKPAATTPAIVPPPLPTAGDVPLPPSAEPPPVPATAPPTAAPTAPPAPAPKPQKPKYREPDESAFFPEDGATRRPPPAPARDGRWEKMRGELYRCGYDSYCQERVQRRYCGGYWGRVQECVPPQQTGYPPPRGYAPY